MRVIVLVNHESISFFFVGIDCIQPKINSIRICSLLFIYFLPLFFFYFRSMWDALLKSVRCEIISFKRNDQIDAYVLR